MEYDDTLKFLHDKYTSEVRQKTPELFKLIEDMSQVFQISRNIMSEKNLPRLLNLIMTSITQTMNAERATLYLIDEEKQRLRSYIAQKAELRVIELPIGVGIAGYVAQTGQVLNIKDAYRNPHFNPEIDKKTGFRTHTILCMPIYNKSEEKIGVCQVLNKKRQEVFTEYDEYFLKLFMNQAAIAIENARLLEEKEKVFRSLVNALIEAIDRRDPVTSGHSKRVTEYSLRLGKAWGLSPKELRILELSAIMHDVGKIGIKDRILCS